VDDGDRPLPLPAQRGQEPARRRRVRPPRPRAGSAAPGRHRRHGPGRRALGGRRRGAGRGGRGCLGAPPAAGDRRRSGLGFPRCLARLRSGNAPAFGGRDRPVGRRATGERRPRRGAGRDPPPRRRLGRRPPTERGGV
ncbi:MAG: hypothetical protein AVDCRST_MAG59-4079, partial [uncultured Thermomicrobiales bacterium]